MGKKLSIAQRAYNNTGWHKSTQFSSSDIKDIKVLSTKSDKALNAIPSPFARLHLVEAAFDLLDKDELNGTNFSGDSFKKFVSDCFDVFELLYNFQIHRKEGRNISIEKWDKQQELTSLKNGKRKHKLLAETLEIFLKEEAFEELEDFWIIKFENKPIAGSSPYTGFFTAPNAHIDCSLYNPNTRCNYFSRIIPLAQRKPNVQRYINYFFTQTKLAGSPWTKAIRTYLDRHFANLSVETKLKPFENDGGYPVQIFGTSLMTGDVVTATDYLEQTLVRINYNINTDHYHHPFKARQGELYDFLLPLKPKFFEDFAVEDVKRIVSIRELDRESVEIVIDIEGAKITKKYFKRSLNDHDGEIIDLAEDHAIKINIGVFPFLKVTGDQNAESYNDFYRIGMVIQALEHNYTNSDFNLKFGKSGELLQNTAHFSVERQDRSIFNDRSLIGTTYFSLNTCFDFIQIELPLVNRKERVRATIVPKWQTKSLGTKKIDYSIDFGTTTTFIAFTDDSNHNRPPQPFSIEHQDIQFVMLHSPLNKRESLSWSECYGEKSLKNFPESVGAFRHEFIPSILSKNKKESFGFPIRTALFQRQAVPPNERKLLTNANIAFTYQKEANNLCDFNQEYVSNLKWNIKNPDNSFKASIKVFLEEIFYLLRTKTLLNDGDPRKSKITWFSPLSFTPASKHAYKTTWEDIFGSIFKTNIGQVRNLTESEAPYYYLYKNASINDTSAVLTIDIGGGSTDMMYFSENQPVLGTSVHFGANVLWGSGFNEFVDKSNGIYESIKDKVASNLRLPELKLYNEKVMEDFGSDEIINFWLLNNADSKVTEELSRNDFKLSYLLHMSSLVYHFVNILKHHRYSAPTCIIFSGNGSKYIDLIQSKEKIEQICAYIIGEIYQEATKIPQVILPEENRKEATCYGGLYRPESVNNFKSVNYLGFEGTSPDFKRYADIDVAKDSVFTRLQNSFAVFIDTFFRMNYKDGLSFRSNFGIETNLNAIKSFLSDKASENLRLGFEKRRSSVDGQDEISDSLFFYPLVGLIYKLNKLSPDQISNYIPKTIYYGTTPDDDNEFYLKRLTDHRKPDSIFSLVVNDDNPNIGELEILNHPQVHKLAIGSLNGYLKPVCDWDELPQHADQEIKTIRKGLVEKQGDRWIVKERIKVAFN